MRRRNTTSATFLNNDHHQLHDDSGQRNPPGSGKIHVTNSLGNNSSNTASSNNDYDGKYASSSRSTSSSTTTTTTTTELVDNLLVRTQQLMNGYKRHYVAFSGGVDSSLVAALVYMCSQNTNDNNNNDDNNDNLIVRAILGISPAVSSSQVQLAEDVATHIGIPFEQIYTTEGTDPTYIKNDGRACYACKTHLYTCMTSIMKHLREEEKETTLTSSSNKDQLSLRLYNGTNGDDVLDPTRVGLVAANEFNVQSPLQHISKEQVRLVSKHIGLPNWNYASSPCLRSRIAIGVHVSPHKLHRIEKGEQYLRKFFHVSISDNLRVRVLSQNRAMIEIDSQYLQQIMNEADNSSNMVSPSVSSYFQDELGFASVNIREFRSGSVAAAPAATATATAPP